MDVFITMKIADTSILSGRPGSGYTIGSSRHRPPQSVSCSAYHECNAGRQMQKGFQTNGPVGTDGHIIELDRNFHPV